MRFNLENELPRDYKKQAFLRDGGKCRYCGLDFMASLSLFWAYGVDHIVASSVGGKDTLENVVTCCRSCNAALSRAGHLRTFEERKAYVMSEVENRLPVFIAWQERFRQKA
jgi:5-methylcytosine-specific restriction endonuclease McrA